jgi:hypothetical protein
MNARAAIAAAVVAACARHDPAPTPAPTTGPPPAPVAPAAPGAAMIETVHELARLLASGTVTVDALVHRLGPITIDHGRGGGVELRSADPRVARILLWRDADTGVPSMLDLDLTPGSLRVADLVRTFGAYQQGMTGAEGAPPTLIFQSAARDAAVTSLVISVAAGAASLDQAMVATVRFVREPRLD